MSKYLVFEDYVLKDRRLLLAALADLGYTQVEEGEALPLFGYQGDRRPETAALVVRRCHLGAASNDVGFARTPDGYVPIVSEYDQRALHGGRFLVALRTAYSERVVEEVRRRLHGTARRTVEGGVVKITVRYQEVAVPEIHFTIDPVTGKLELHVRGVVGPACEDVARLARELLGAPRREQNTPEYHVRPQVRPQVRPRQGR